MNIRAVASLLFMFLASVALAAEPVSVPDPPAERRDALLNMVRQDCGSCHGLTMRGGLGPSLEPAVLADKDAEQLAYVILHGRRGTPMPPWGRFLSEDEARWIVVQLRRGLPQ